MGTQVADAPRSTVFRMDPDELVIIVDPNHILFDSGAVEPLDPLFVENICQYGVNTAVRARKNGDAFEVVYGRKRVRAARIAKERGIDIRVKVEVVKGDDADMVTQLVMENVARKEPDFVTLGKYVQRLLDMGKSWDSIGIACAKPTETVRRWHSILDLSEEIKSAVREKKIGVSAALQLKDLPREAQAPKLAEILEKGYAPTFDNVKAEVRADLTASKSFSVEPNKDDKNTPKATKSRGAIDPDRVAIRAKVVAARGKALDLVLEYGQAVLNEESQAMLKVAREALLEAAEKYARVKAKTRGGKAKAAKKEK